VAAEGHIVDAARHLGFVGGEEKGGDVFLEGDHLDGFDGGRVFVESRVEGLN